MPCILLSIVLCVACTACGSSSKEADNSSESQETEQQAEEPKDPLSDLKVSFIDVGQGDAALLTLPNNETLLIDAGPDAEAKAVKEKLEAEKIDRIDYVVATHPDTDHIAGMSAVLGSYKVGKFYTSQVTHTTDSYLELLQTVQDKGIEAHAAWAGNEIASGDGWSVKILSPSELTSYSETNDWSVVLLVTYENTSMLFAGDAPKEILENVGADKVGLLKVSHHGSNTGTDAQLAAALSPEYAIISYGDGNDYGHPTQEVLGALSSSKVYGTGVNGTVTAVSDGEKIDVTTEKSGTVVAGVSAEQRKAAEEEAQRKAEEEEAQRKAAEEEAQRKAEEEARARAAEEQAQAEAAAAAAAAQSEARAQKIVVVTPKGKKYHNRGCRTLSRSKTLNELTREQAEAQGYGACAVCNP